MTSINLPQTVRSGKGGSVNKPKITKQADGGVYLGGSRRHPDHIETQEK
jgi:hypothetical protein